MQKSLIILVLGSLLIASGCSAKDDTVNKESSVSVHKVAKNASNVDSRDEVKAPDFKLMTIDGEEFQLSDFSGKVVMLNFWGTWCPPCRKEIPDLVNLQKKYNKDGLEIVGLTLSSGSAKDIQKFAKDKNMNYTILTDINKDETQNITIQYGMAIGQQISSIPTTLLIDREGYIVKGYLGPRSEEVFYSDIKQYL